MKKGTNSSKYVFGKLKKSFQIITLDMSFLNFKAVVARIKWGDNII